MPVIIAVTIPSKLLGFGKLSEFPQSPPFYLPSGGWTGPRPPRSGPCIVLTAVAPLASRAAGAEPQAAPSLPGKEPGQSRVCCPAFLQDVAAASAQDSQPSWALCLPAGGRGGAQAESCPCVPHGPLLMARAFLLFGQCQPLGMTGSTRAKSCLSQHAKKKKKQTNPNQQLQNKQGCPLWTDHCNVMTVRAVVLMSQEQAEKKQSHEGGK